MAYKIVPIISILELLDNFASSVVSPVPNFEYFAPDVLITSCFLVGRDGRDIARLHFLKEIHPSQTPFSVI